MNHTDLALEAHQQVHTGAGTLPGVRIQQQEEDDISITQIKIETDDAARRLEKPIGQYITLELAALLRDPSAAPQRAGQVLGAQLAQLLGPAPGPVLIVGWAMPPSRRTPSDPGRCRIFWSPVICAAVCRTYSAPWPIAAPSPRASWLPPG